jgi:hypothetical protein
MHRFWKETDPQQWQLQLTNFQKNNGLLGGALVIFYVWNQLQGGGALADRSVVRQVVAITTPA